MKRALIALALFAPTLAVAEAQDAEDAIRCTAFWYAISADVATLGKPFDSTAADAETLAYRDAAVRLLGASRAEVDLRVSRLIHGYAELRMDPLSSDAQEECDKEMGRASIGSRCNRLGERLPETRPFFFPDERAE